MGHRVSWLVSAAALCGAIGCGDTERDSAPRPSEGAGASGDDAGAAGSSSATAGRGGGDDPASGGEPATPGAGGAPAIVDPIDEDCTAEPGTGTWSESTLTVDRGWQLAFAGTRALVMIHNDVDGLRAAVSESGGAWSDWVRVDDDASAAGSILGADIVLSPDGSHGFAVWSAAGPALWAAHLGPDGQWGAPALLETSYEDPPEAKDKLVVRSDGRALFVDWIRGSAIDELHQRVFESGSWSDTVVDSTHSPRHLYLGAGETPVQYTTDGYLQYVRRSFDFDSGWSDDEVLPQQDPDSAYQIMAWEFAGGHGLRSFRLLGAPDEMRWITARQADAWGPDEALDVGSENFLQERPAEAGDTLLYMTLREGVLYEMALEAGGWSELRALPRARELMTFSVASSVDGTVGLIAQGPGPFDGGSLAKLYRRDTDGTWYCPRLQESWATPAVAANGQGSVLYGTRVGNDELVLTRYDP